MDRHPLYVAYYAQLEQENTRCLLRASARNKMKRFVTDVHTVWLTNLSHHPEFRRMVRGAAMHQEGRGGGGGGGGSGGSGAGTENQPEPAARRGLDGGRDSAAIAASQSQIQSVQPGRAFRGAFFYSSDSKDSSSSVRQPAIERISQGDGQRGVQPAAASGTTKAPVHVHTSLSHGGADDDEGGKTPELPPPPFTAPAMAVLVAERHRLAPDSTASAGGTRRSLGGGGAKRRSVGGGGDSSSWSDMTTRVLRVVRFAPPPPPPPQQALPVRGVEARDAANDDERAGQPTGTPDALPETAGKEEEEGGGGGTPSGKGGVQHNQRLPSAMPPPEATWMISSFPPYDGAETRVTIGDAAVLKVVGEALSACTPLATAGLTVSQARTDPALVSSRKGVARAGAGGASASMGTDSVAARGLADGQERALVLRHGARVPILREDGSLAGRALSVVEVRLSDFDSALPPGRVH